MDAEPHPEHGPIHLGPHHVQPNWQHEVNGAAPNLGFFGGNPHPIPAHPIPLDDPVFPPGGVQQGAVNVMAAVGNVDADDM